VKEGGDASDIMAIATYRDFLTLFPSHPMADDAQLEIAEAYFRMRSGPDRDQTQTLSALEEYQRLLELYPQSDLAEKARTRIGETRQSLARAEYLAGYFYQRTRQWCRAAIPRYEGIMREYPDFSDLDDVLLHLAECLHGDGRTAEALPHLGRLIEDYPQSPIADQARRYLEAWPAEAAARPVPPASPAPAASPAAGPPAVPPSPPAAPPSPPPSPAGPR
jgi:outer membrane protein assembly factor BamD